MVHRSGLKNYAGSMEELAEEIGDLRYDALSEFLELLAHKIQKDGDKDKGRGRIKLATHLHHCANEITKAQTSIDKAWIICEPYM